LDFALYDVGRGVDPGELGDSGDIASGQGGLDLAGNFGIAALLFAIDNVFALRLVEAFGQLY
jgi:hypothetical protein